MHSLLVTGAHVPIFAETSLGCKISPDEYFPDILVYEIPLVVLSQYLYSVRELMTADFKSVKQVYILVVLSDME